jgi:hypothetical protein
MSTTTSTARGETAPRTVRGVALMGLLLIIFGAIMAVAGVVTWVAVGNELAAEKITVSEDAPRFAGQQVDTPWEAYTEAEVIQTHAMETSGGKTYAELDREDPKRQTVMTASFLRASLFTSVVSFGVALMAAAIGVGSILTGVALQRLARRP